MVYGRGFKSRQLHHYPMVTSLSLPLNNPVGPQAWRGFSLYLADLASRRVDRIPRFLAVFPSLFSTSCERAKLQVHKISPLQIKGLAHFWNDHFFRASLERCPTERKKFTKVCAGGHIFCPDQRHRFPIGKCRTNLWSNCVKHSRSGKIPCMQSMYD